MVALPLKRGGPVDLHSALVKHISAHFDQPGETYASQLRNLMQLRANAAAPALSEDGLGALKMYQAQADFMQARFYHGETPTPNVSYPWQDTLTAQPMESGSIAHEQANVLYNMAAVASNLARQHWENGQGSEDAQRAALTLCKQAAAAVTRISNDYADTPCSDLARQPVEIYCNVFLGQAHDVILTRGVEKGSRGNVLAGVALQAAEHYDACYKALLLMDLDKKHPFLPLAVFFRLKAMWRRAVAQFYQAKVSLENREYGEEVGRLKVARDLAREVMDVASKSKAQIKLDMREVEDFLKEVEARFTKAERENVTVFQERVPNEGQLSEIEAKQLAKAETYQRDPGAKDVLANLLSLKAHLAASEFSEMKNVYVRQLTAKAEHYDLDLDKSLDAMDLSAGLQNEEALQIPPELYMAGAALRDPEQQPPLALQELLDQIFNDYDSLLERTRGGFNEAQTRAQAGGYGAQEVNKAVGEYKELEDTLNRAQTAVTQLQNKLNEIRPRLDLLSGPHDELRAAMPKLHMLEAVQPDPATQERVQELLNKVQLMRSLRKQALSRLREEARRADATAKLGTAKDPETAKKAAMAPLEDAGMKLETNFESQSKLLTALAEAYASLSATREQAHDLRQRQQAFVDGLKQASDKYNLLKSKTAKAGNIRQAVNSRLARLEKILGALGSGAASRADSSTTSRRGSDGGGGAAQAPAAVPAAASQVQLRPKAGVRAPAAHRNTFSGDVNRLASHPGAQLASMAEDPYATTDVRRLSINDPGDLQHLAAVSSLADAQLRGVEGSIAEEEEDSSPASSPSLQTAVAAAHAVGDLKTGLDVAIEELTSHIRRVEQAQRDGQSGFEKEFALLRMEDLSSNNPSMCSIASRNTEKNRYRDILPFDSSRVLLEKTPSSATGDGYINACHVIDLLPGCPRFVCAQGPLPSTVGDFWTMICQQRAHVIVMVTNLVENDRAKCEQYWPEAQGQTLELPASGYGPALHIKCLGSKNADGWIEREFLVLLPGQSAEAGRRLRQFHYTAWPDRGVPKSPKHFLQFLFAVKNYHDQRWAHDQAAALPKSPIAVHCSAGVGRTGTFCCVYAVVSVLPHLANADAAYSSQKVNIMHLISQMRKCRRHMVQTLDQYQFCYQSSLQAMQDFNQQHGSRFREQAAQRAAEQAAAAQAAQAANGDSEGNGHVSPSPAARTVRGIVRRASTGARAAATGARAAASNLRSKLGRPRSGAFEGMSDRESPSATDIASYAADQPGSSPQSPTPLTATPIRQAVQAPAETVARPDPHRPARAPPQPPQAIPQQTGMPSAPQPAPLSGSLTLSQTAGPSSASGYPASEITSGQHDVRAPHANFAPPPATTNDVPAPEMQAGWQQPPPPNGSSTANGVPLHPANGLHLHQSSASNGQGPVSASHAVNHKPAGALPPITSAHGRWQPSSASVALPTSSSSPLPQPQNGGQQIPHSGSGSFPATGVTASQPEPGAVAPGMGEHDTHWRVSNPFRGGETSTDDTANAVDLLSDLFGPPAPPVASGTSSEASVNDTRPPQAADTPFTGPDHASSANSSVASTPLQPPASWSSQWGTESSSGLSHPSEALNGGHGRSGGSVIPNHNTTYRAPVYQPAPFTSTAPPALPPSSYQEAHKPPISSYDARYTQYTPSATLASSGSSYTAAPMTVASSFGAGVGAGAPASYAPPYSGAPQSAYGLQPQTSSNPYTYGVPATMSAGAGSKTWATSSAASVPAPAPSHTAAPVQWQRMDSSGYPAQGQYQGGQYYAAAPYAPGTGSGYTPPTSAGYRGQNPFYATPSAVDLLTGDDDGINVAFPALQPNPSQPPPSLLD